MHGGLNGDTGPRLDPGVVVKLTDIWRPASVFTFMDKAEQSMTHGAMIEQPGQTTYWLAMPGERDRGGGANVVFADSHHTFKKWQYLGRKRINFQEPISNQQDRTDLKWVLNALPGGP